MPLFRRLSRAVVLASGFYPKNRSSMWLAEVSVFFTLCSLWGGAVRGVGSQVVDIKEYL